MCLQESRTWNQLAPCGLQPGPLALSCMAMTLNTGEALALIHSHANSFVITGDFWYASVLVGNGNASFAGVLQTFLGVLYAGMSAEQALADLGNITKTMVCRDILMSLPAHTAWTSPNVWTRTAHCRATLSATLSSLASEVPTQAGKQPLQTYRAARRPTHGSAMFQARRWCRIGAKVSLSSSPEALSVRLKATPGFVLK